VTFSNTSYFQSTGEYLALKVTSVTPTTIKGKLTIPKTAPFGDRWYVNVTTVDGGNNTVPARFTVVKPLPTITTMTPTSGVRTSIVSFTLAGTNFQPGTGNTTVTLFNQTYFTAHTQNITANLISVTPTGITGNFTVPEDSPFGNAWVVNVTTADGGMSMSPITFAVPKQLTPTITAIAPTSGNLNSTIDVTLTGTNFQVGTGGSNVTFTNTSYFQSTGEYLALKITSVTPTTIKGKLTIPNTVLEGDRWFVNVTTVDGGNNTVPARFTIVRPVPVITTMVPSTGARASLVTFTLTGTNFQPGTGNTTVTLSNATYFTAKNRNVTATLTMVTPTTITGNFTVPDDSVFGNLWFVNVTTADGGSSLSRVIFTENRLAPTITLMTPDTGYPNGTVTYQLSGTNFQPGLTSVTMSNPSYGALSTSLYSVTPTQISGGIQIPVNAPLGAWKVNVTTADGGTTTWSRTFTVSRYPAPLVSAATPTMMFRGTTASFTLTGNYFQTGGRTMVNLTNSSGYNITTTLTEVYPTTITGTVTIPDNLRTGYWKVNVTTVDGGLSTKVNTIAVV
jgi:hypothetical protein